MLILLLASIGLFAPPFLLVSHARLSGESGARDYIPTYSFI